MNVIAIDSGGTKIIGAVVDEDGNILVSKRYKNEGHSGNFLVDTYREIISMYKDKYDARAVGLGVNGRIDTSRGIVMDCSRYDNYQGRHIQDELRQFCGIPVSLNNDCYSTIYGEIWKGAARNAQSVVGLIIGTGLGGGIYEDGKFVHGSRYGAGEIGHQILYPDGAPCFCGQRGCVEKYVSGTGLWEAYNRRIGKDMISSGYEFFDLLHAGDKDARAVLDGFVRDLALVMINAANFVNPELFLIGGGLANTSADWKDDLQKTFESMTGPFIARSKIVYVEKGNDAALLGAAKFAFDIIK